MELTKLAKTPNAIEKNGVLLAHNDCKLYSLCRKCQMCQYHDKYIITATSYFSKWVEAIPVQVFTSQTVSIFPLIYRFGIPKIINKDNGQPSKCTPTLVVR